MSMASIRSRVRKDGSASHQVIFRRDGRNSPQEFATFDDYAEAVTFRDNIHNLGIDTALEILDVREGGTKAPTVAELTHEHAELLTGVTAGTRKRYHDIADRCLGALADLPVNAVTARTVGKWVNALEADGLAGKTIANRHGLLYAVMERARDDGTITKNPCKDTRLPTSESKEMVFLTESEFAILLQYIRPDAQDLVTELVGTGHRFGESTALQVRDWDSGNRRVTISRSWKYSGTSSKPYLGAPKTKRSKRSHTVSPTVAAIYNRLCDGKGPQDFIFVNSKGDPWRAAAFHSSVWQPAVACANGEDWQARRAEWEPRRGVTEGGRRVPWRTPAEVPLGKRPRAHDLRHTAASWWLQSGVDIVAVSRRLGHESIKTTVDTYGHLSPEQDARMDAVTERQLSAAHPQIES